MKYALQEFCPSNLSTLTFAANLPGECYEILSEVMDLYENVHGPNKSFPHSVSIQLLYFPSHTMQYQSHEHHVTAVFHVV